VDKNQLYYGDNIDVLRDHSYFPDASVDLVYLDPPFNSNRDYNAFFEQKDGRRSAAQIKAFTDTWRWDIASSAAYEEVVLAGGEPAQVLLGLRSILGTNDVLAYLSMMAPRLIELRRVLKDTGTIFLHCDPTASHYLKVLMDGVFGASCFVNEIIWHYRKWSTGKYGFQRNHDVILFYARSPERTGPWHQQFMERAASALKRFGSAKIESGYDEEGRRLPSVTTSEESEGVRMDDVWDIGRVPPPKQLFPTEKPLDLLVRIIETCTNEDDIVLDPFCGCGTAIMAAQQLNRNWRGIDVTHLATNLIKFRLLRMFGMVERVDYQVTGEPTTLDGAIQLAADDPYQFQWWSLGRLGARAIEKKKGADLGIDGKLFFHDDAKRTTKQIIFSVKSGKLKASDVRDLRGVIEREQAEIGVLVSLGKPTDKMRAEAATAGFYKSPWGQHPKLQLLQVEEILQGKQVDCPPLSQVNVTFKKADAAPAAPEAKTAPMFDVPDEYVDRP
jgi:site-specific DNA-methyltransferase (adenine-specific)